MGDNFQDYHFTCFLVRAIIYFFSANLFLDVFELLRVVIAWTSILYWIYFICTRTCYMKILTCYKLIGCLGFWVKNYQSILSSGISRVFHYFGRANWMSIHFGSPFYMVILCFDFVVTILSIHYWIVERLKFKFIVVDIDILDLGEVAISVWLYYFSFTFYLDLGANAIANCTF